jgi:hypothetical protein
MNIGMKKEVLIAILIGFSLGLTITYGVYRVRLAMQDQPPSIEQIVNATPTPASEAQSIIAVHSPTNGTVQTEASTTVAGTTLPNAFVVLFVNNESYIQTSDATGNFSFEVPLVNGGNILIVHVVNEDGQSISVERTIVVTSVYSSDGASEATPSAEQS